MPYETGATLIDSYSTFVYGDGNVVKHMYQRDGIHHNTRGSSALVRCINKSLTIVKTKQAMTGRYHTDTQNTKRQEQQKNGYWRFRTEPKVFGSLCKICGRNNHKTVDCRYREW